MRLIWWLFLFVSMILTGAIPSFIEDRRAGIMLHTAANIVLLVAAMFTAWKWGVEDCP
jgi:hypothetical protein